MTWADEVGAVFGAYDEGFGPLTVDVPAESWIEALTRARDELGCGYFDWMSAVDELAEGFAVLCHLARLSSTPAISAGREAPPSRRDRRSAPAGGVDHLLLRTKIAREQPRLPTAIGVYAGAGWHERETAEMFGIAFTDGPAADPEASHLLLPEEFEGHPLRKEFVLASRVAKPWPGAKEPGESDRGGASPSRRKTRPPGVPDPEQWGPREPGSESPDPLAHAAPQPARPRRGRRSGGEEPADG
ncbi:MAG TPA: NADH-quinone oxidoreductase subunit C [Nocardioidaceae bacterium]|nr:NADH-quinone oxidoreductase subunit C [Nocardioidaceae bacterium]